MRRGDWAKSFALGKEARGRVNSTYSVSGQKTKVRERRLKEKRRQAGSDVPEGGTF